MGFSEGIVSAGVAVWVGSVVEGSEICSRQPRLRSIISKKELT